MKRKRWMMLFLLTVFLLTSCAGGLPELPWSGSSDDSGASSEEQNQDWDQDRESWWDGERSEEAEEDRSKPENSEDNPDGRKLSEFLAGLLPGDGSVSGSAAAPAESAPAGSEEGSYEIFSQLPESFFFSSGAGGWGTSLSIYPNGSFDGLFHDSEMGDIGDGYPGGTVYICDFSGTLSKPVKVNDYIYSTHVMDLNLGGAPGDVSIEEEIRWIYSEPYGLDDVDEILIYCPDAPVAELPEEFKEWVHWDILSMSGDTLNFYGLYNVNGQQGYSGY